MNSWAAGRRSTGRSPLQRGSCLCWIPACCCCCCLAQGPWSRSRGSGGGGFPSASRWPGPPVSEGELPCSTAVYLQIPARVGSRILGYVTAALPTCIPGLGNRSILWAEACIRPTRCCCFGAQIPPGEMLKTRVTLSMCRVCFLGLLLLRWGGVLLLSTCCCGARIPPAEKRSDDDTGDSEPVRSSFPCSSAPPACHEFRAGRGTSKNAAWGEPPSPKRLTAGDAPERTRHAPVYSHFLGPA